MRAGGGGFSSSILYDPRFLAGSRPSNRVGKWCIYGVSFIVATCTLVFPQYGLLGWLLIQCSLTP